MKPRLVGIAAATIVAVQLMGLFLPSVHEVRDRRHGLIDPDDLRKTAMVGAVVALVVASAVAVASRTPAPIVTALVAVAIVGGIYEWALRNPVGG